MTISFKIFSSGMYWWWHLKTLAVLEALKQCLYAVIADNSHKKLICIDVK